MPAMRSRAGGKIAAISSRFAAPTRLLAPRSRAPLLAVLLAGVLLAQPAAGRAADPPVAFTHGVACGDASSTEVVLWTRTAAAAALEPQLLDATGAVARTLAPVHTGPDTDFTVKAVATDLAPGAPVTYRFAGPAGELSPVGTCRTAPAPDAHVPITLGFSGDADWKWRPYPLLNALNREPLDFFVFLGDTIYETTNATGTESVEDLSGYRMKYRENRELPPPLSPDGEVPLRTMYSRFGLYEVPDNHELGVSAADPNAPRYTEGGAPAGSAPFVNETQGFKDRAQAFSEYQPLRDRVVSGTGDPRLDGTRGYYFSQPWGTVARVMVVDDRSYRDVRLKTSDDPAADDPNRTMLGRPQLSWLENELLTAQGEAVTWKFVVISSPIQQIGRTSEIGVDADGTKSWAGGYRVERDRLLKFIDEKGIDNVVFLTTDNHYTMVNNLRYRSTPEDPSSPLAPARNAFEIITGPIGASTGLPVKVGAAGADGRTAERAVADALAAAQKAAGLDAVGLEPEFPGLLVDSVSSDGGKPGLVAPADFAAFNSYTYAVLQANDTALTVRVTGIHAIDPAALRDAAGMAGYQAETPRTILSFTVQAQ